jgi:two-component system nitrate/nitrite response regulator NarL
MDGIINVGLIDNDRHLLATTGPWLSAGAPDIVVSHQAVSVDEYLGLAAHDDVVLLDLELKDGSRFTDNVERLARRDCRVLVLSVHAQLKFQVAALKAGAIGYLTKGPNRDALVRAIRQVATNTYVLEQELAFAISRDRSATRPQLSTQEHTAVKLRAAGMKMRAIAETMNVKERTAISYLERAKAKYRAADRPFSTITELQERMREDGLDEDPIA